jgi:hypothetical protein
MHDLDSTTTALSRRLRDAAELAPDQPAFALEDVHRLGRRRIRNRRAISAGAGVAVVITVAISSSMVAGTAPGTHDRTIGAGGPGSSVTAPASGGASPTKPRPTGALTTEAPPADSELPVGEVIKTLTAYEDGDLALWFNYATEPERRLQLHLGSRDSAGQLRSYGSALKFEGEDLTAGFGAGYAANSQQPRAYALFGYIVGGDVARVTLKVAGQQRTAKVATWSENPKVHAWWLLGPELDRWPARTDPPRDDVEDLTAYDSDGRIVDRNPNGEGISRG